MKNLIKWTGTTVLDMGRGKRHTEKTYRNNQFRFIGLLMNSEHNQIGLH